MIKMVYEKWIEEKWLNPIFHFGTKYEDIAMSQGDGSTIWIKVPCTPLCGQKKRTHGQCMGTCTDKPEEVTCKKCLKKLKEVKK
jgi:hypothetical protein